ncbi:MAG: PaaI family thioesterase [Acidimicrobiia bacterium]|nr:PaaI family thioesterase [Acidimicrobiia bacterium]
MSHHPAPTTEELRALIFQSPIARTHGFVIEEAVDGTSVVRLPYAEHLTRVGGVISGPAMAGLADAAVSIAILSHLRTATSGFVTTSMTLNFLRPAPPTDLVGKGIVLRVGRRLAIGEARIHPAGDEDLVAHAVLSFTVPSVPDAPIG